MSKTVSAKGNLSEAKKINKSPFQTKIDRYPDVVSYIRGLVADGKAKIQIHQLVTKKFPDYDLGSRPTIYNWIEKYGHIKQEVEVTLYTPKYFEHMEQFDVYKEMLWSLKELKERYESAKKAEGSMPIKQQHVTFMLVKLIEKEKEVAELEIRLGLRAGESDTAKTFINNQTNTFQVGGGVNEEIEIKEISENVRKSIDKFVKSRRNVIELQATESKGTRAVAKSNAKDN